MSRPSPLLVNTLNTQRRHSSEQHPDVQECINNLVDLYQAWDKPQQADEWRGKLPDERQTIPK